MSRRPTILFQFVSLVAVIFIVTVLMMVAALFSDPNHPVNLWFNRYAIPLLLGEVGALLILGFLAMAGDQTKQPQPDEGSEIKDERLETSLRRDP